MSAIARYFHHAGYAVSGYDRTPSALTAALEAEGIAIHYEDRPEMIPPVAETFVIYTPAIPEDLGEMRYVREKGYALCKRSRALGEIARGQKCLAVSGTHGKTTTSTLLAHILTQGGGCTAFLGGISKNYDTNLLLSRNPVLVAEADEFDRSFLQLNPAIAVVTATDADHLDIYSDRSHLLEAFGQFAAQVSEAVIVKAGVELPLEGVKARVYRYAYDTPCDFYASEIVAKEGGMFDFTLNTPMGRFPHWSVGIPGWVNVENAVAAAAVALCFALAAAAQTRPYDRAIRDNPWLSGTNAAGLREVLTSDISYAELYAGISSGGLHRTWEAPSPWEAGAEARTVKHLERFSMKGGFSFGQMSGAEMCGSMSLRPGYFPLDVLEFTPGRKTRQTYAFDGGVSVDLADGWRLGASMDFTSANYAKRKDLRHTDYLLDMTVSPGLAYTTPSGGLTLGVNYIYRKTSESVVAEQVGTGGTSYYAFLDKGLMYGKYEVWSGSGVHLDEAGVQGFPMQEQFHGVGLQIGEGGTYYAGFAYLYGNGSAGEKQSVWYRFPSHNVSADITAVLHSGTRTVYLREFYGWRYQTNNETVLEKVVSGGVTLTEEYGSNRILSRELMDSRMEVEVVRPGFEYVVCLEVEDDETTVSQIYPYVTESELTVGRLSFTPVWYRGSFDFGGSAGFGAGRVEENDSMAAEDSGVLTQPYRLQDYYDLEMQYLTAPKADLSVFLRWNLPRGIYVEADGGFRYAFGAGFPGGSSRASATLKLGWTF